MNAFGRNAILAITMFVFLVAQQTHITPAAAADAPEQAAAAKKKGEKSKPSKAKTGDADKSEKPASEKTEEAEEKEEPAKEATEEKKEEKPKHLELSGVIEARKTTEIAVRPKAFSTLKVLSAVEHGQRVKAGQLLLALDLEAIDNAISDLRAQHRLADLTLKQSEITMKALEGTTPLGLASAQRAHRNSQEDFQHYQKIAKPLNRKSADFSIKAAKHRLEYQEEELRQLEAMYKADDITEETEEIILKRARNAVESARFMYEMSKVNYDKKVKSELPRQDETMRAGAEQANVAWQSTRQALPLTLEKERLAFEKAKVDRQRSDEKLEKLLADRAAMIVKAPVDGVLYYGQFDRGRWSGASTLAKKLRLGGSVLPNEVVMTIVQMRPISVRATLDEKNLTKVRMGDKCKVVPTGHPELELEGIVGQIGSIPIDSEKFDLQVTLAASKAPASLGPGMTCKVKFALPEEKKEEAEEGKEKPAKKKD